MKVQPMLRVNATIVFLAPLWTHSHVPRIVMVPVAGIAQTTTATLNCAATTATAAAAKPAATRRAHKHYRLMTECFLMMAMRTPAHARLKAAAVICDPTLSSNGFWPISLRSKW